jgi:hypothetical protein
MADENDRPDMRSPLFPITTLTSQIVDGFPAHDVRLGFVADVEKFKQLAPSEEPSAFLYRFL